MAFVGWQRQDNGLGVQQVLEHAITAFTAEDAPVYGAGRTDAGVHAMAQVAHFDLEKHFTPNKIREAMNAHVRPHPVAILEVDEVDDEFHARFSAQDRSYQYRILNRRAPAAIEAGRCWHVSVALDADAMHDAAQVLVGEHDFTAFRATVCQAKSPVRTLSEISVTRVGDDVFTDVRARSFLHNQVRIIMGSLRKVGEGRWTKQDLADVLAACDRTHTGQTAPPQGLYLKEIRY
jgi:tRNA pseudouridine38-40 synthase